MLKCGFKSGYPLPMCKIREYSPINEIYMREF
jgi:hypothetical protein